MLSLTFHIILLISESYTISSNNSPLFLKKILISEEDNLTGSPNNQFNGFWVAYLFVERKEIKALPGNKYIKLPLLSLFLTFTRSVESGNGVQSADDLVQLLSNAIQLQNCLFTGSNREVLFLAQGRLGVGEVQYTTQTFIPIFPIPGEAKLPDLFGTVYGVFSVSIPKTLLAEDSPAPNAENPSVEDLSSKIAFSCKVTYGGKAAAGAPTFPRTISLVEKKELLADEKLVGMIDNYAYRRSTSKQEIVSQLYSIEQAEDEEILNNNTPSSQGPSNSGENIVVETNTPEQSPTREDGSKGGGRWKKGLLVLFILLGALFVFYKVYAYRERHRVEGLNRKFSMSD